MIRGECCLENKRKNGHFILKGEMPWDVNPWVGLPFIYELSGQAANSFGPCPAAALTAKKEFSTRWATWSASQHESINLEI